MGVILAAFGRLPIWAYALAALLAWGMLSRHQANSARVEAQRIRAEHAVAVADAERRTRAAEQAERDKLMEADRALQNKLASASSRAAADRSELDRVRKQAARLAAGAAPAPGGACEPERERIRVLSGLLAEGAALAAEGGERVGRLDARLSACQQVMR